MNITYPIKTVSESNMREHWAAKHRRSKEQRNIAHYRTLVDIRLQPEPVKPWRIVLTRIGKKRLDTGNLPAALKAVQDGICDALGIDDGDPAHEWIYEQRIGKAYGVELQIETRQREGV